MYLCPFHVDVWQKPSQIVSNYPPIKINKEKEKQIFSVRSKFLACQGSSLPFI